MTLKRYNGMTAELNDQASDLLYDSSPEAISYVCTQLCVDLGLTARESDTEALLIDKYMQVENLIGDVMSGVRSGDIVPRGSAPEVLSEDNADVVDSLMEGVDEGEGCDLLTEDRFAEAVDAAVEEFEANGITDGGEPVSDEVLAEDEARSEDVTESMQSWVRARRERASH